MATSKDTASFFENGTTHQFEYCYKLYPKVLELKAEKRCKKPQELIRLDQWYQHELPKLIKARGKDAHMSYDELVQTMKWKQSRGKFYPQLSYLIKVNTPRAVMQETKKAFRKLPNLEQAITALSNLKGVGTTMASALLAAAAPNSAPFMADECLMAIPEIEGIDYTTKEYLNFCQHIQTTVERLNVEVGGETPFWSPHRVELALWAHYVANDLSPELLDEMPGPDGGGGCGAAATTNGSTNLTAANKTVNNKEALASSEETNDGELDDESLGGGVVRAAEINNTATDTETENENTNPMPLTNRAVTVGVLQDGDSNFVSNDSTSQEPIIDENTTQTTATTSTDDGELGTPLVSDSESNMEPPLKAPLLPHSNNNSNNKNNSKAPGEATTVVGTAASVGNGNGNGTLLSDTAVSGNGDSLDGENSNCLRSLDHAGTVSEFTDEEDRMADESSSNSNSRNVNHQSLASNNSLNDAPNTDNDSTLSSPAGIGVGQKRALNCGGDVAVTSLEATTDVSSQQPEAKKIRSG